MNIVAFAAHHARTVVLGTVLVAAAGLVSAWNLPNSIYPPLEFPRVVVIARSGTLPTQAMTVTVTRPLEQAAMAVPGIRRVRSRTFRGATEVDAFFESSTNMVVAQQQLQGQVDEIRQDLPPDTDLAVERLTPATFPVLSLNVTGALSVQNSTTTRTYVVRPALARAPGAGRIEVLGERHARSARWCVDPARLGAGAASTVERRRGRRLTALTNRARAGRAFQRRAGSQHLALATGPMDARSTDIANAPVLLEEAARSIQVSDVGDRRARARRTARSLVTGQRARRRRRSASVAAGRRRRARR